MAEEEEEEEEEWLVVEVEEVVSVVKQCCRNSTSPGSTVTDSPWLISKVPDSHSDPNFNLNSCPIL